MSSPLQKGFSKRGFSSPLIPASNLDPRWRRSIETHDDTSTRVDDAQTQELVVGLLLLVGGGLMVAFLQLDHRQARRRVALLQVRGEASGEFARPRLLLVPLLLPSFKRRQHREERHGGGEDGGGASVGIGGGGDVRGLRDRSVAEDVCAH